jgi:hypothetical protein
MDVQLCSMGGGVTVELCLRMRAFLHHQLRTGFQLAASERWLRSHCETVNIDVINIMLISCAV